MILLDEFDVLRTDEDIQPPESFKERLHARGMRCRYACDDVLYRYDHHGSINIYYLCTPSFKAVSFSERDLYQFKHRKFVVTMYATIRDIGLGMSRIYLEDTSFTIPTEVLLNEF